jgi:hypothetical protein
LWGKCGGEKIENSGAHYKTQIFLPAGRLSRLLCHGFLHTDQPEARISLAKKGDNKTYKTLANKYFAADYT